MLQACLDRDLIVELTLQPVRRYRVDAAILFSDITVPLALSGISLRIEPGVGPVFDEPVRRAADVARIRRLDRESMTPIVEAVGLLVGELAGIPLIGFAGAPFTLASYLVEGGPSRDHAVTKALMYSDPPTWHALLDRLADISREFLLAQIDAGVSVVQVFDSWAGALHPDDYRRYVAPHSAKLLAGLPVPRIHFGVGTGELLPQFRAVGADVVGVDWRVPLDVAARRIGADAVVQGNLDPAVVFAPWPVLEAAVRDVLIRGRAARGHIFNLGHGVLPSTDPGVLAAIVDFVHAWRADRPARGRPAAAARFGSEHPAAEAAG